MRAAPYLEPLALRLDDTIRAFNGALLQAVQLAGQITEQVAELRTLATVRPAAPAPPSGPRYLDIKDVAVELSIGISKVTQLIDAGELREIRIGRRRIVIAESVAAYQHRMEEQNS